MSAFTAQYLARLEGWSLLASLLQGALILASWRAWQRAAVGARVRHRLACAHFAALGLLPLLTLAIVQATIADIAMRPPQGAPDGLQAAFGGLQAGAALGVATLWAAGVAVMLLRLAHEARSLARVDHAPASPQVVAALRRAARTARLLALPRLREAAVPCPLVVGWRSPLLLVPRGLCATLDADEIDAVLLHELAHLRRGDLGWNLLQRVVLALLWFHPVAWRLQASVSRERERCCDALAVRHGARPRALARALVKLAEAGARPAPALAMAVSRGGALVERVQDLLEPSMAQSGAPRRAGLATAISAAALLAIGAGRGVAADPALGESYLASAFGPTIAIQAHDGAGSFALWVRQGRVIQASMQDRPVPIAQQGSRVTLGDKARAPLLVLTVTPQGRVQWESRR